MNSSTGTFGAASAVLVAGVDMRHRPEVLRGRL